MNEYRNKLRYHAILLFVLGAVYAVLGTVLALRSVSDTARAVCQVLMVLLLLVVAACFDRYAQPYLNVYRKSTDAVPWLFFAGFAGAAAIAQRTARVGWSIAFLLACLAGALALYGCSFCKARTLPDDEMRCKIVGGLIRVDDASLAVLQKRGKFCYRSGLLSLVLILAVGKALLRFSWAYAAFCAAVFAFELITCAKIYAIRYVPRRRARLHLSADAAICLALLTLSVLLNAGIVPLGGAAVGGTDITMCACFATIPFARQGSFAYFAAEHARLRNELGGA